MPIITNIVIEASLKVTGPVGHLYVPTQRGSQDNTVINKVTVVISERSNASSIVMGTKTNYDTLVRAA